MKRNRSTFFLFYNYSTLQQAIQETDKDNRLLFWKSVKQRFFSVIQYNNKMLSPCHPDDEQIEDIFPLAGRPQEKKKPERCDGGRRNGNCRSVELQRDTHLRRNALLWTVSPWSQTHFGSQWNEFAASSLRALRFLLNKHENEFNRMKLNHRKIMNAKKYMSTRRKKVRK